MQAVLAHPDIKEQFASFPDLLPSDAFKGVRKQAMNRFLSEGLPATRDEEWKYTDLSGIAELRYTSGRAAELTELNRSQITASLFDEQEYHRLVFVNGFFSGELSSPAALPGGVIVSDIASVAEKHPALLEKYFYSSPNSLHALNTALTAGGMFLSVPDGVSVSKPIQALFFNTSPDATAIFPKNIILAGNKSRVHIVQQYASTEKNISFTNAVTDVSLGKNAEMLLYKTEALSPASFLTDSCIVMQQHGSRFSSLVFTMGGQLVRNNLGITLEGEQCETAMHGLYLVPGTGHTDNHTFVDHASPSCHSNELYKGIIGGKGTAVFNGKIMVRKDAQKTSAFQSNKNILLSDEGTVNSKPQLEIFADDVKCSHGATIGQLDEEELFYLRARGIGEDAAREMLLNAFASSVVDTIQIASFREYMAGRLQEYLPFLRK